MTALECFATDVLGCGTSDLSMLDEVYSNLSYECGDPDYIIQNLLMDNNLDLNKLLEETYRIVKTEILSVIAKNSPDTDISEVEDREPYANCLDTHFDSALDQTVDWDKSIKENAEALIEYLKDVEE